MKRPDPAATGPATADHNDATRTPSGGKGRDRMPADPEWYQLCALLGRGGMGAVYEAIDLRLGRRVAIKFLHGDAPEHEARFMREARSQASVEHEHICKVYEVGESDGKPFIVMQLIKGQSLDRVASEMSLEQKLLVIQQVAEALHEAHRVGLVHRDLKPGNIMVTRLEDGTYKPFVLDFGLVRQGHGSELTLTGDILGTPSYMAPEQARGEINLDRRTDVYGLGATLYCLLLNKPPFSDPSMATVLMKILQEDPPRPRLLAPGLPRDVETIVMTCLEKARDRRYATMRDLARDLGAWLNGEPIAARHSNWLDRLGKRARRHRRALIGVSAAVALLLLSLGWGVWRAANRARLARELTSRVKEIEATARYTHLSRSHDIRPVRERLRREMAAITAEIEGFGAWMRGPGEYALGWGNLVLGHSEPALDHLERAWRNGYRETSVAYALGLTYSTRYRESRERARLVGTGQERARHERIARETWREPALRFMKRARSHDDVIGEYLSALIAYCEDRYADALPLLAEAKRDRPWFYEAQRLRADIYRDWARSESFAGRTDRARELYGNALEAYEAAILVGQSDPSSYKAMVRALMSMMYMEMYSGDEIPLWLDRGLAVLADARRIHDNELYSRCRIWRTWLYRYCRE